MHTTHAVIPISAADRGQLRDLLHMNLDSRDGFAYAGKRLADKHSSYSIRFHRYSQQRNEFYEKLKEIGESNHQAPIERGTIAASLHRTWMELRDEIVETVDVSALIVEALRGEGYIKQAYETALSEVVEPHLSGILTLQYQSIQESFSWLEGLCEDNDRRKENAI